MIASVESKISGNFEEHKKDHLATLIFPEKLKKQRREMEKQRSDLEKGA